MLKVKKKSNSTRERGSTVFLMAVSMVFMVAMAALAIDVVVLYVVRSEAQRAADAAALAGAHVFVSSGLTSGLVTDTTQLCNGNGNGSAQQAAISVAQQNNVGGQAGVILSGDIQCNFSKTMTMGGGQKVPVNPLITVKVTRQNIPTFFSRIWGTQLISAVSASATAEAFNMTGNGTIAQVQSSCLKPFLLPNLDPQHGGNKFVDTANNGIIINASYWNGGSGGAIGEQFTISPGDPSAPAMGHFLQLNFSSPPTLCPNCALGSPFLNNIQCCNTDSFQCGTQYQVNLLPPSQQDTFQGTKCMIHGPNQNGGADNIIVDPPPFQFIAGSQNPTGVAAGTQIGTSDSVVTIPLFDPNGAVTGPVPVIGFLQIFIGSVDGAGRLGITVLNVVGCTANNTAPSVVTGGGISPVTVRLVQPGGAN